MRTVAYPYTTAIMGPSYLNKCGKSDYAINSGAYLSQSTILPGIGDAYLVGPSELFHTKAVRAKDIKDGLGNTYLVAEKTVSTDRYETGSDVGDSSNMNWSIAGDFDRIVINGPRRDLPAGADPEQPRVLFIYIPTTGNSECLSCLRFGSAHSSIWNAVFCDGSVHSLSYNIDLATHQALASRAGGETVDASKY